MSQRLASGVLVAARQLRPPGSYDRDDAALISSGLWEQLQPLRVLEDAETRRPESVDQRLDAAAAQIRREREVMLAVLLAPQRVLRHVVRTTSRPDWHTHHLWMWMCWVTEAAWRVLTGSALDHAEAVLVPVEVRLFHPIAARLRFLVLSEPFRHQPHRSDPWPPSHAGLPAHGLPGIVFGTDGAHILIARCQEARWEWQRCLDEYQSHPLLAQALPEQIETELDLLSFRCPLPIRRGWWRLGGPLVLSRSALDRQPSAETAADDVVATDMVERHLLPRFRLTRVARLANGGAGRGGLTVQPGPAGSWVGVAVVVIGALAAVLLAAAGRFTLATWVAVATYLALGLQVLAFGRRWATQWLLRLPAAGAVGLVVLVALAPTWWQNPMLRWQAPAVLVGASLGYLVIEARNHGVGCLVALGRAFTVAVIGCVHALLLALIGLVTVTPSYAESSFDPSREGYTFTELWSAGALYGEAWSVLSLATAWCLAVGVFSQILWDDRPISAPLAHLRWRRETGT